MRLLDKHPQKPCYKERQEQQRKHLAQYFQESRKKSYVACGSTQGNTNGTATAARRLDNNVYVVRLDALPPVCR